MVLLSYSRGRFNHYSNRLHEFSVTIPRCYKDVCLNSFLPRTVRLWNSLSAECFPLTHDLLNVIIVGHGGPMIYVANIPCIILSRFSSSPYFNCIRATMW